MDIHPSATLWGDNAPLATGAVAELERQVTEPYADLTAGLLSVRMDAASRSLRLPVRDLRWEFIENALRLEFRLDGGGYATAVLREIAEISVARPA
jgi:tRNA pseudouridine13 synthase